MENWSTISLPRPSFSVPSVNHQTLLSKTLFEQAKSVTTIAAVLAASSSFVNSSLAPNLAKSIQIDETNIDLFSTFFTDCNEKNCGNNNNGSHPASIRCQTLQFVPQLNIAFKKYFVQPKATKVESEPANEKILSFFSFLRNKTKYFVKSLRSLTVAFPTFVSSSPPTPFPYCQPSGFGGQDPVTDARLCYSVISSFLALLPGIESLTTLVLCDYCVGNGHLAIFNALEPHINTLWLDLTGDANLGKLRNLSRNYNLKYLSLRKCREDTVHDLTVLQLSRFAKLEQVDLSGCQYAGFRCLQHLEGLSKLQILDLTGSGILVGSDAKAAIETLQEKLGRPVQILI